MDFSHSRILRPRAWAAASAAAALLFGALPLAAVQTHFFDHQGFRTFAAGELEHLAVGNSGRLESAPGLRQLAAIDEPVIWDAVAAPDGTLYLGTGNRGKVLRVATDGTVSTIFDPDAVLTRALALDADGNLYVATSPSGSVFRIPAQGGRPELFFDPDGAYIWDLAIDDRGNLWVATGMGATLIRVPLDAEDADAAETWFSASDEHFSRILVDTDGSVLIGSIPRGIVYRVTAKDEGRALFRAEESEITGLAVDAAGRVLFSAYNASSSRPDSQSNAALTANNELPPFVVSASGGDGDASGASSSSGTRAQAGGGPPDPAAARGKSSGRLYRIDEAGIAMPLWQNREEGILSMLAYGDAFHLIGTNVSGRVYAVRGFDDWQLIQTMPNGGSVQHILADPVDPGALLIFTGNPAAVYRLGGKPSADGVFTSEVVDGRQTARWGMIEAVIDGPATVSFETRSGNTDVPDATWSDWENAAPAAAPAAPALTERAAIASPPARFLQYRMRVAADSSGGVQRVRGYYQLPNSRPVITSLNVLPFSANLVESVSSGGFLELNNAAKPKAVQQFLQNEQPRYQLRRNAEAGAFSVVWRAFDPNGDTLEFDLALRPVGADAWLPLQRELTQPFARVNTRGLADGFYQLRVTVSDRPDNVPAEALQSVFISDLILVDNLAPTLAAQRDENWQVLATDTASRIVAAYVSVDGGDYRPLRPVDGLFDTSEELFEIVPADLGAALGATVVVEVYDEAGNAAIWNSTL